MFTRWVKLCTLLLATLCTAACASTPPTPRVVFIATTPVPQASTPRVVVVTATPSALGTPGTIPGATELPLPTLLPSVTPLVSTDTPPPANPVDSPTPTVATRTRARTATPASSVPGVYVDAVRVEPARPIRGAPVTFIATFVNTTGEPQPFNWLVLIYRPEERKAFGQTSAQSVSVPTGTTQLASADNWRIPAKGDCESFTAQVNWQDSDKSRTPFASTTGRVISLGFDVCPP